MDGVSIIWFCVIVLGFCLSEIGRIVYIGIEGREPASVIMFAMYFAAFGLMALIFGAIPNGL